MLTLKKMSIMSDLSKGRINFITTLHHQSLHMRIGSQLVVCLLVLITHDGVYFSTRSLFDDQAASTGQAWSHLTKRVRVGNSSCIAPIVPNARFEPA